MIGQTFPPKSSHASKKPPTEKAALSLTGQGFTRFVWKSDKLILDACSFSILLTLTILSCPGIFLWACNHVQLPGETKSVTGGPMTATLSGDCNNEHPSYCWGWHQSARKPIWHDCVTIKNINTSYVVLSVLPIQCFFKLRIIWLVLWWDVEQHECKNELVWIGRYWFNPQRPKHPLSRKKMVKLGVEIYPSPNVTALIMTEGARLCCLSFPLAVLCGFGDFFLNVIFLSVYRCVFVVVLFFLGWVCGGPLGLCELMWRRIVGGVFS